MHIYLFCISGQTEVFNADANGIAQLWLISYTCFNDFLIENGQTLEASIILNSDEGKQQLMVVYFGPDCLQTN